MEEHTRYTIIYHWKGSGEYETNDREKRKNLYRDRTSGGNPAGIVLSYFCERTASGCTIPVCMQRQTM